MIDLPNKKYNIIYVDPPWPYKENWGNGAVHHHYKSMSIDEISNLPIQDIAEDNCYLYFWYTNPLVREAHKIVEDWEFIYKQTITWVKTYSNGEPIMGLGYDFRGCTEHLILAKKGTLERKSKKLKNILYSEQRRHSEKPDQMRDLIISHVGDLPRIELFARKTTEGWDSWGNETDKFVPQQGLDKFLN